MNSLTEAILAVVLSAVTLGLTLWVLSSTRVKRIQGAKAQVQKLLAEAETRAKDLIVQAKEEHSRLQQSSEEEVKEFEQYLKQFEERLATRETTMNRRIEEIQSLKASLDQEEAETKRIEAEAREVRSQELALLEQKVRLPLAQAREMVISRYENEAQRDLESRTARQSEFVNDAAESRARDILIMAIQRYTDNTYTDPIITEVNFKNSKTKARILGPKNEQLTEIPTLMNTEMTFEEDGNILIITGFDIVKRKLVAMTLEYMVRDPKHTFETALAKARQELGQELETLGDRLVKELRLGNIPPQLKRLIGRLRYRTSFGQNVYEHCREVGYLAQMIAYEVGVEPNVARLGGLFHDIGKAVDVEVQGTHDVIGKDLAEKFGLDPRIAHAIHAHHEIVPYQSVEARVVQVADQISGGRPGARYQESLEEYIARIQALESIATGFVGVEKASAMQAGRELWVYVRPESVNEEMANKLSKEIAGKIESEMTYPGEIKVQLIRETHAIDYAK